MRGQMRGPGAKWSPFAYDDFLNHSGKTQTVTQSISNYQIPVPGTYTFLVLPIDPELISAELLRKVQSGGS